MQESPLNKFHINHGAHFVDFAGWNMPIRYGSIQEEHRQVRESGGIFDVSHMGRVDIEGRHARRLLEKLCTRRIHDMSEGQCRYSLVCNEHGGVRDDVIVMRRDDDEFTVVVNASNREKMLAHFEAVRAASDFACKINDRTFKTAMVALQGPKVMELIAGFSGEIPALKRYRFTVKNLLVMKVVVSRTGYTGEDGIEAILPTSAIDMAMKLLLKDVDPKSPDAVLKPAGLGARDTLRLEAGMPLYGHELGEEINALASGLGFAINLDKIDEEQGGEFIGAAALRALAEKGGPPRRLVGLRIEGRRTPRQGMRVNAGGAEVGEITSGCLSPTLGYPIAMAYVDAQHAGDGTTLEVAAEKGALDAQVVPMPFYRKPAPAKA